MEAAAAAQRLLHHVPVLPHAGVAEVQLHVGADLLLLPGVGVVPYGVPEVDTEKKILETAEPELEGSEAAGELAEAGQGEEDAETDEREPGLQGRGDEAIAGDEEGEETEPKHEGGGPEVVGTEEGELAHVEPLVQDDGAEDEDGGSYQEQDKVDTEDPLVPDKQKVSKTSHQNTDLLHLHDDALSLCWSYPHRMGSPCCAIVSPYRMIVTTSHILITELTQGQIIFGGVTNK